MKFFPIGKLIEFFCKIIRNITCRIRFFQLMRRCAHIRKLFLFEAGMIGLIGGVIGIGLR